MKTLQDTPTADLLAELMELEKNAKSKPVSLECVYARQVKANRHSEICYELDRRCDKVGLCILPNGQFRLQEAIQATELRDLLTWLIMKGGNG